MSFSIRRKRLACLECTRRKVKCDKILPCRNCVVKGISCTRPRGQVDQPFDIPSPSYNIGTAFTPNETSNMVLVSLVENLTAKVNSLESTIRQQQAALSERISNEPLPLSSSANTPVVSRDMIARNDEANEPAPQNSSEIEDAATILEFLAWGRRKDPKYQDLITIDDTSSKDIDIQNHTPAFPSRTTLRSYLQSLLPGRSQLYTLVKYHCDCLLWYHGSFHAVVFLRALDDFFSKKNGQIQQPDMELQWASLLFAIVSGSIICAPRSLVTSWGFSDDERKELSHRWFQAMNLCLQYSDYMSSHSIFSVQAIATVTHSAHMLGHSNSLPVLLASAVRIAQSMGLHRLGDEVEEGDSDRLIDRELGRRVWCQLCTQDWFSIPFTESYLINRTSFNTAKPRNCNDEDMISKSDDIPTTTNYMRHHYDVAALMPKVHDAIVSSNTLYTRYEKVLEYDQQLRLLATVGLPYYLQNVPLDPSWPCYVPWARRALAISTSHKVIMIHRKFLGLSFVNSMFSRTRRTCVAAARTIVKELKETGSDGDPVLWIHHAFVVTAGIILCLDMIHSQELSPECDEHRRLVQEGLRLLSICETNMIAKRGVPLIQAILSNEQKIREKALHKVDTRHESTPNKADRTNLDISEVIRHFHQQDRLNFSAPPCRLPQTTEWFDVDSRSIWPPSESRPNTGGRAIMLPSEQSIYGIDFPDNFEEVFALAENYII